ncbi:MAG: tetratricopeptide repeat protein [Chloroflexota bacterium]|nr:tetratricopeptide repeat protein [Chloroflexota bacterium]
MADKQEKAKGELQALLDKAREAYHALRLDEALDLYQQAARVDPESFAAHVGLAKTLTRMRRQKQALDAAQQALELAPQQPDGHTALGTLFFLADQNEKAREALERAIELDAQQPESHLTLAQVYADLGRLEDAESQLERAQELIEGIPEQERRRSLQAIALHARAYKNLAEGNDKEAMERAEEIVAFKDANPHAACLAYANLGILEARKRRYAQAVEHLEKAFRLNPYFYRAGGALGRLLLVQKQHERAAEVLETVLDLTPDAGGGIHYAYGMALAKLGQREKAIAQYREALDKKGLRPLDSVAARWKMIWLSKTGRYLIIGLLLAAVLAWLVLARPSPQAITLVAIVAVIVILQRIMRRQRG